MKKIFILTAAALTVFAACSKEKDVVSGEKVPAGMVKASFYADIDQTKSTESGAVFSWTENEEVAVVAAGDANKLKFTCDNVAEGHFTGTIGEGKSFGFAISPYNAAANMSENGGVVNYGINFASDYNDYVPGTTNAIMVGTPGASGKFMFRHAAAAFKFTVENVPVGTATISVTTDANITGTVSKDVLSGSGLEISNSVSGLNGKKVNLKLKDEDVVSTPNQTLTFYVPVPTGNYTSLTVTFFDGNLNELVSKEKTGLNINLSRGDVYYTPKMTLDAVTPVAAGTVLFDEPFTGFEADDVPTAPGTSATVYGNASVTYACADGGTTTKIYAQDTAGGDAPEMLIAKGNGEITISGLPTGLNEKLTVTWNSNNTNIKLFYDGNQVSATEIGTKLHQAVVTVPANTASIDLTFKNTVSSTNGRLDNIHIVAGEPDVYEQVKTPTFSPVAGTYTTAQDVTISCETDGATIYYTLDGSAPSDQSTLYNAAINVSATTTIKAIAVKDGMTDSEIAEARYTIGSTPAGASYVKVTSELNDWSGQYLIVYETNEVAFDGSLANLDSTPNTFEVTIDNDKILSTSVIDGKSFTIAPYSTGYSILAANGKYIGRSAGSNGLDSSDSEVVNTISWTDHPVITGVGGKTLGFNSASNQLKFRYLGNSDISLYKLADSRPSPEMSWSEQSVSASITSNGINFSAPTFTAGYATDITYNSTVPSVATIDATTGEVTIVAAGTTKIQAIFAGNDTYKADTQEYTLTVNDDRETVATPTFSPVAGEVASGTVVTISTTTQGATIYYTTDGSTPTTASTQGTSVIISEAKTVKAIAVKEYYKNSEVASAEYTILIPTVGSGTEADPYTAGDILDKYPTGSGDTEVYVTGTITDIEEVSTSFGNATYTISDGSREILVYRGKYIGNVNFTSEDQIALNDIVVVFGKIGVYKGTPQLSQDNYLISITADPNAPALSVSPATTSESPASWPADNEDAKEFTVTATNGSWDFDASSVSSWVTVVKNGNVLSVTPKAKQAAEAHSGSIVITLTPSQSGYTELTETIYLSQAKYNSGGDVVPPANTVLFSETFDSAADGSSASVYYSSTGATGAYNSGTYGSLTYTRSNSNNVTVENAASAGGTAKQIMINKNGGSLTISGIKSYGATSVRVTFKYICAKSTAPITATCGSTNSGNFSSTSSAVASFDATVSGDTFDLVIRKTSTANSTAARFDDITITVLN